MKSYDMEYIKREAHKELARRNYIDYVEYVHRGQWKPYKMHRLICEKLEELVEGKDKRLIIAMPPRHGKSFTVTETFPSYYMTKNFANGRKKNVIQTSYSGDFAEKFGLRNRNKITEFAHELFGASISKHQATKGNWALENEAMMLSVGIGGQMTGEGADLIIIDDPIKNREEAESQTIRQKIWDEWESTISTRLQAGGSVILIQTRWHEDDLAGRLIEQGGWEVISFPVICEDNDDLLGRKLGEPLCPELGYDKEWANRRKIEVGSRTWESVYQQRPTSAEGNLFKRAWFKYYTKPELPTSFDVVTQSWDFTFKDEKENDYVVGTVWGKKGAEHFLLYRTRKQMNFTDSIKAILYVSSLYPEATLKLVEDKANGPAIINMLRKKLHGIVGVNPDGSKYARASAVEPLFEAGNIYLPIDVPWLSEYIEEMVSFPNGKHDDQVDSTAQYLQRHINPSQSIQIDTNFIEDDGWDFY